MRAVRRFTLALLTALVLTQAALATTPPGDAAAPADSGSELLLIFDASGSMWGQVKKESKIEIARRVLKQVLAKLPDATPVALVVYGHRSKTDCDDIETIVAPGTKDRAAVLQAIASIQPKGMTPISKSIHKVVELLRSREQPTTVVLISDGIETCGGDACKLVREARAAGVKFVMHVVGFDLAKSDVSQLECTAQAGGGLYFTAADAAELSAALEQAVVMTPDAPSGKLSVRTTADGKLTDVLLTVTNAESGQVVTLSRTYIGTDTNPRVLPLPDGKYDVLAQAVQISSKPSQRLTGIEIRDGGTVEKSIDFGTGSLRLKVTSNGQLADATYHIYRRGTREVAGSGRTYKSADTNPTETRLPAGSYDVEIAAVDISGRPKMRWEAVEVGGSSPAERAHDFPTGTLRVGASAGGKLVDVVVEVGLVDGKTSIAQGRTYTSAQSNPKSFDLTPGLYRVTLRPTKMKDLDAANLEVQLDAGATVERMVELAP